MRRILTAALTLAAAAAAIVSAGAVPAAAATARAGVPVTASTRITGRPDSGGNGNWATDSMTRTLTITRVSGTSYTATLRDSQGSFVTGRGDFVPNQAASPGVKFTQPVRGTFSGRASFSFTASEAPSARLVPRRAAGSGPADTSDWYKLAFPAGTVFGGTGIAATWGWSYTTRACLTISRRGFAFVTQSWNDFAANNAGQGPGSPAAGQIADAPHGCLPIL